MAAAAADGLAFRLAGGSELGWIFDAELLAPGEQQ